MNKILIFLGLIILFFNSYSQESSEKYTKIGLVPQFLFINGIRLDIEKSPKYGFSTVFAPQLYLRQRQVIDENRVEENNYFKSMYGAGFDIYEKYSFTGEYDFYFAAGLGYNYFNINFAEYQWLTVIEDNLEFIKYELTYFNQDIHRGNLSIMLGVEESFDNLLFFELYTGIGMKYSFIKSANELKSDKFNKFMYDYAYSGTVFIIGLKIGFIFERKYQTSLLK